MLTPPFDTPFPVPEYPPAEWFTEPTWVEDWRAEHGQGPSVDPETGILKLTVADDGRVGGWFFDRGACIIHAPDACPGPSPTQYAAFHQNDVIVEGGAVLRAGVIGMTHGHASPWVDWREAQRHYSDPSAQMIVCRAGDSERGAWVAGAVVPGLTWGDVAMLRRSALSGDWRRMPASWWRMHGVSAAAVRDADGFDCIGPTLVTRPALPLVASFAASLDGHPTVLLGGPGGIMGFTGRDDGGATVREDVHVRKDGGMRRTIHRADGSVEVIEESADEVTTRVRTAAITAALIGDTDLPLADRDAGWDSDGAEQRVRRLASSDGSGDVDTIDWTEYARAFLWRNDDVDPETFVAYGFGFADVVDNRLHAVPRGIFAVASVLQGGRGGTNLPDDAQDAIRGRLNGYYAAMAEAFDDPQIVPPWGSEDAAVTADVDTIDVIPEDGADGGEFVVSRDEWESLMGRLSAVEEFCASLVEAQVASIVADDAPMPNLVAVEADRICAEDVPLPA